jgi:MoxR-like ATPase
MIQIDRLDSSEYQPDPNLVFVDTENLHGIYDKLAFRSNLLLVGPKGIGKTLSIASWCGNKKVPLITYDCSEDARRSHLLGTFFLRDATTSPFILGPLTTAFEVANEVGQAVLVLEEINSLTPQMQKVLNAVADFRKKVLVPEARKVFKLRDNAKLWITGTMNTTVYGGVYSLNEDLKSRFRMLPLDYPSADNLRRIVTAAAEELPSDPKLLDQVLTLAMETQTKTFEYALSPRDVVQILEDITRVGLEIALRIVTGKFEDEDRITLEKRILSGFGINVNPNRKKDPK